jgi:2-polyprenyl-6-methoxyphenol hydroxylase-like FAD-dependent oxidoreductase
MRIPAQRTRESRVADPVHGDHAVVLGASMSGLLASRVLADHFEQVTLVERDRLTGHGLPRRGVPQARHAHVLLPRGATVLGELFPGLLEELVAAGVPVADNLGDLYYNVNGHTFFGDAHAGEARRSIEKGKLYKPSRPFLEAQVLRRVMALPNVDVLDGCDVEDLVTDAASSRVSGVRVTSRGDATAQRSLVSDLVVVATGRSGRAPAWLESMGFAAPEEEEVRVDLKYVTHTVRFPTAPLGRRQAVLVGPVPERPTIAGALEQEGHAWVVTFGGYGGHHPPMDKEGWLAFGDRILPREFAEALHEAEPLDGPRQHRFPANLRRRYDRLERFPGGLLVLGDAVCSFNPIYGQGMTVAALEALALEEALEQGWPDLAKRFFKAAAIPAGNAWSFATGGDLSMPASVVPGSRPFSVRAMASFVDRFQAAAEHDPVLAWRFIDVTGFEEPPSVMFSADSIRRMASDRRHHRRTGALAEAVAEEMRWP